MANKFIQILTTVASRKDAKKIAKVLYDKKLSACTQIIGPVESIYRWKGKLQKSKEYLCVAKTKNLLYRETEKEIKKIHPYKLPEIIVLPIINGSNDYFKWIEKEVI